jgi:hypothetical protein
MLAPPVKRGTLELEVAVTLWLRVVVATLLDWVIVVDTASETVEVAVVGETLAVVADEREVVAADETETVDKDEAAVDAA